MFGFAQPARHTAADDPDSEPGGAEEDPGDGAGQGSLGGPLADHVALLVQIDVAAGERTAHDDPVVPVVLDEGDLVNPRRVAGSVENVRIRPLGALDVSEDHERQVERHQSSSIRLRWASVNSRAIDGSTSTTATPKTISTPVSVALGAAPSSIVSVLRQQVRVLGDAPAPDHGDDGADRERRGRRGARRGEQHEHGGAAQRRDDHERQPVAGEAVVDVARVGVQRDDARRRRARPRRRRPPSARVVK